MLNLDFVIHIDFDFVCLFEKRVAEYCQLFNDLKVCDW